MKTITLFMILLSGLVSGYFIGDYRGRHARIALENTIKAGTAADRELQNAKENLQAELAEVNHRQQRELEMLRADHSAKSAEWARVREGLNDTVRRQHKKLAELDGVLAELVAKLGGSAGAEKRLLEQNIALLKRDIDALVREVNGNTCLDKPVPYSVVNALNGSLQRGSKE